MLRGSEGASQFIWSRTGSCNGLVGADAKVDGGGGARALRGREEEEDAKRQGGEWKGPPVLFIKAKG